MSSKLNLAPPSGARDFLPQDMALRLQVLATVRAVFERHGFAPMDTPAMERIETLTGKYGEEGEKLIFKILKRGEQAVTGEADMALRYDLTVPSMRAIAANRHKLPRIFKRYAIGPVWRADRPGKGRFREFYQCDVDIIGAANVLADAEILLAKAAALDALNFPDFEIRLNSRKVLKGMMGAYGVPIAAQTAVIIAIDKLDKIGMPALGEELDALGLPDGVASGLFADISQPDFSERLKLKLADHPDGAAGLAEVAAIQAAVAPALKRGSIPFDPLLARGMDYYTGAIFEFYATSFRSAIAGGGRYDGLIEMFSKKSEPVCGGSLGIERIIMLLSEGAVPARIGPTAYVTVWDAASAAESLSLVGELRAAGVRAEIDLTGSGLGQQLRMADERGCRAAVIRGPDEAASGMAQVKQLESGVQTTIALDKLADHLLELQG